MRFGFYRLNSKEFDIALSTLEKDKSYVEGKYTIAKLLVTADKRLIKSSKFNDFIIFDISSIENFVRNRLAKYRKNKCADRMFFSSSLIQYLCWKEDDCNENEKPHNEIE